MGDIQKSLNEATEGFKQTYYGLLIFAGICSIALLVVTIAIFKNK
jgi:hypothetical protein